MKEELRWFLMGITMVLIIFATATTALAQTITDLEGKEADVIMAKWDSLSDADRIDLLTKVCASDPLKIGELYSQGRSTQPRELMEILEPEMLLDIMAALEDEEDLTKVQGLLQALDQKKLKKLLSYEYDRELQPQKVLVLLGLTENQVKEVLPALTEKVFMLALTNTDDPEILKVVSDIVRLGKCKTSKGKASSRKSKTKKEPKEEKKEAQLATGTCSEEQVTQGTCSTPIIKPPKEEILIP